MTPVIWDILKLCTIRSLLKHTVSKIYNSTEVENTLKTELFSLSPGLLIEGYLYMTNENGFHEILLYEKLKEQ